MGARLSGLMLSVILLVALPAAAFDFAALGQPQRRGLALYHGVSYNPDGVSFHLLSLSALYDYRQIWEHDAPLPLRFKLEAGLGLAQVDGRDELRLVAAGGVMARYNFAGLAQPHWLPYAEAGIGLIYTDFQVEGQGLRLNFNPRLGVGCNFGGQERQWFAAVHAHHLSNAQLHSDNRGINSILLQFGRYF